MEILEISAYGRYMSAMDASDLIYAFDASRSYNSFPHLPNINAKVLAIDSADDQVNPPELGLLKSESLHIKDAEAACALASRAQ